MTDPQRNWPSEIEDVHAAVLKLAELASYNHALGDAVKVADDALANAVLSTKGTSP